MIQLSDLPFLNAILNSISTFFLFLGFYFIKNGNREAHKKSMLTAFTFSAAFLISYLIYHYTVGSVKFTGPELARTIYLIILIPHIILAIVMVPFIAFLLTHAFGGQFEKHKKLARFVWPVWVYVSVTGVIVYLMNYIIWPSTQLLK